MLMNTKQLCEYLQVSRSDVHRWIKNRELPAYRLGSQGWRYKQEEIDVWLIEYSKFCVKTHGENSEQSNASKDGRNKKQTEKT